MSIPISDGNSREKKKVRSVLTRIGCSQTLLTKNSSLYRSVIDFLKVTLFLG